MNKKRTTKHGKHCARNLCGVELLNHPLLNKGTAFTKKERSAFGLDGLLPQHIETLATQSERAYKQFQNQSSVRHKNLFLHELNATNQILFYHLVQAHLDEMLPILYTPNVADAVTSFNSEFRRPTGLYLAYPDRKNFSQILKNYLSASKQAANYNPELIVVTDGERILGIGDQGIGGVHIAIAKGMLYTLLANIHPAQILPIVLDVGTNNRTLLDDPLYLGWRHERLSGKIYDSFIAEFISAIQENFPYAIVHWEDFGRDNAARVLARYRNAIPSFNDDIQGTGVVTLAAILSAIEAAGTALNDQRIVILGGGTAGIGIASQIIAAMKHAGINEKDAYSKFWVLDKDGLLISDMQNLTIEQQQFARNRSEIKSWKLQTAQKNILLYDVINNVKPTILIGCSTMQGAFTEDVVRLMAKHCAQPIIFPLSNPINKSEATPAQLLEWTDGKALIATGSPFPPVNYRGQEFIISQCNNALVYPGIGLGVITGRANKITDDMLWAACTALSEYTSTLRRKAENSSKAGARTSTPARLLPPLSDAPKLAPIIASAVIRQALSENVISDKTILKHLRPKHGTQPNKNAITKLIASNHWTPKYLEMDLKKMQNKCKI